MRQIKVNSLDFVCNSRSNAANLTITRDFFSGSQRAVYLVECLPPCDVFLLSHPTLPLHDIFGGKCTTVFGAINMLSAFARVGAFSLFAPAAGEVCSAGPEWMRGGRERRDRHSEERREESVRRRKWVARTLGGRGEVVTQE